ncbi:Imm3 family immunity protein [Metabacillus niabensis]|uniref:Imm3 family immunity protein n=1 Tax=Metabacillus niabensis TaxID=324854 RepID=UPI0039A02854
MEDWEYDELFNFINEYYQDFLALNRGHKYAIARTAYEFQNLGYTEDFIVDTAIGEISLTQAKVFIGYIEGITKRLSEFKREKVAKELTNEEIEDLSKRINRVIEGLKTVEVDYNPLAE